MGQRKNAVEIGCGQKLGFSIFKPTLPWYVLALGVRLRRIDYDTSYKQHAQPHNDHTVQCGHRDTMCGNLEGRIQSYIVQVLANGFFDNLKYGIKEYRQLQQLAFRGV